jgi:hypothetical protein
MQLTFITRSDHGLSRPPGINASPFEGLRPGSAARTTSPPNQLPLVRLAALKSVVGSGGCGLSGLPAPARRHRLRTASRACHLRLPDFDIRLILSCASPSLQSPRSRAGPALLSGHLPWAFLPHRDISVRSPRARASQAHFVPPSTFLTSSTASSSAHLCGFVSPRSHVQGSLFRVFPSREAARARRPPLPSCRYPETLPAVAHELQTSETAFRALLLSRIRRNTRLFRPRPARYPPELRLPRVLLRTRCR